jgi:hypothetical protein
MRRRKWKTVFENPSVKNRLFVGVEPSENGKKRLHTRYTENSFFEEIQGFTDSSNPSHSATQEKPWKADFSRVFQGFSGFFRFRQTASDSI